MARGVRTEAVTAAIKAALAASPYSQNQIAQRLGASRRKQLYLWENGGGITLANARALEKAAGVKLGTISDVVRLERDRLAAKTLEGRFERERARLRRRLSEDA